MWTVSSFKTITNSVIVFNCTLNATGDYHRSRLAVNFTANAIVEMLNHYTRFCGDGEFVALNKGTELLLCFFLIVFGVIGYSLNKFIKLLIGA